jgi:dihydroneopterin aldolase
LENKDYIENRDELIYDLIFGEKINYSINISDYITDIYQYEDFISEIKKILKKSKVKVVNSVVKLDSRTALWELKVRK